MPVFGKVAYLPGSRAVRVALAIRIAALLMWLIRCGMALCRRVRRDGARHDRCCHRIAISLRLLCPQGGLLRRPGKWPPVFGLHGIWTAGIAEVLLFPISCRGL